MTNVVTAVSPLAQIPTRHKSAGARRMDTFEGKTVYIVDVRWPHTHAFMEQLQGALAERLPSTEFRLREKMGPYGEDDPKLWAEIQDQGDGVIVGVGH